MLGGGDRAPRVEYTATPLGRSLSEPVIALVGWAADNHLAILESRSAFDEPAAEE